MDYNTSCRACRESTAGACPLHPLVISIDTGGIPMPEETNLSPGVARLDATQICDIITTWLTLVEQRYEEGGFEDGEYHATVGEHAETIRNAIWKSDYLGRRFAGEPHRNTPCPLHKGQWSGIFFTGYNKPDGCECDGTGWVPE